MNGVLALPTISIPPGATVKLSGWDFASAMRISAADAVCARAVNNKAPEASHRVFKLCIVNSPRFSVPRRDWWLRPSRQQDRNGKRVCQPAAEHGSCIGYTVIYPRHNECKRHELLFDCEADRHACRYSG